MNLLGKTLIILGILLISLGLIFVIGDKVAWFGRLPGDIMIKKEKFTFYFPITTCILVSIVISVILFLFTRK